MTDLVKKLHQSAECVFMATASEVARDLADVMNEAADDIERLHTLGFELALEKNAAITERDSALAALQVIRDHYGKVCRNYELCTHDSCQSSYGAWATADEALHHD